MYAFRLNQNTLRIGLCWSILCFISIHCAAQPADTVTTKPDSTIRYYKFREHSETRFSLLLGYNYLTYGFAEAGVGYNVISRIGYHGLAMAAYLSSEVKTDNQLIIGPKVGCWMAGGAGGIAMGASFIYYTDFTSASLRARPEIGFGIGPGKLTYGWNIALSNKSFNGIDKHLLSFALMIKLKKIKETNKEHTVIRSADWVAMRKENMPAPIRQDTIFSKSRLVLLGGIGGWGNNLMGEIGIGGYIDEPENSTSSGLVYFSIERFPGTDPVTGVKFGNLMHGTKKFGLCGGAPMIYYTDLSSNSWIIRPTAGIHYKRLFLVYGYNIALSKFRYGAVGYSNVTLLYSIVLKRYKDSYELRNVYE